MRIKVNLLDQLLIFLRKIIVRVSVIVCFLCCFDYFSEMFFVYNLKREFLSITIFQIFLVVELQKLFLHFRGLFLRRYACCRKSDVINGNWWNVNFSCLFFRLNFFCLLIIFGVFWLFQLLNFLFNCSKYFHELR